MRYVYESQDELYLTTLAGTLVVLFHLVLFFIIFLDAVLSNETFRIKVYPKGFLLLISGAFFYK